MRPWPKKNKMRNIPTGGFPSKLESAVHDFLKKREYLGEITDIKLQQTVVLQDGGRDQRITWRVDFSFIRKIDGELVYAEAKGFQTDVYRLKLKLFKANPPADLEIYGGSYQRLKLLEKITIEKITIEKITTKGKK
jgi:hypothetical protein